MAENPLLSIVIANFNYGRFLSEAIESILSQSCQNFELIIIDGGSTDDSVEVIKEYAGGLQPGEVKVRGAIERSEIAEDLCEQRNFPISYWISEKDKGQSDAFNKGFAKARGRFLTWLNADDVMLPGTIERLRSAVARHPDCEWFVGGVLWLDPQMRILNCGRGRPFSEIRCREGDVSVWGPSSFFTKRLLNAVGGVDERFHYKMDSDLWLRFAYIENARYRHFCRYAWGLRLHPAAKMSGHNFKEDGTFDSQHSDEEKLRLSRHHAQLEQESNWMSEYFHPKRSNLLRRLLSISYLSVLLARFDCLRWKGHSYREIAL